MRWKQIDGQVLADSAVGLLELMSALHWKVAIWKFGLNVSKGSAADDQKANFFTFLVTAFE